MLRNALKRKDAEIINFARKTTETQLSNMISTLPEHIQDIFAKSKEKSYREIAESHNMSAALVRKKHIDAIRQLKRIIKRTRISEASVMIG